MYDDPQVVFAAAGLERAAELRADAAGLGRLAQSPGALCLPVWRGKVPLRDGALDLLPGSHPALAGTELLFLGLHAGRPYFAAALADWDERPAADMTAPLDPDVQHHPLIGSDAAFTDIRALIAKFTPLEAELAATARALLAWHETHGFCARCGQKSQMTMGGWQRQCPACAAQHFPRTDPVVIMLVTRGNRALVGRSPGWPEGMYSLLAGFMEPGETIEAAVRREVVEEAGIAIGRVRYLASQPWPFPASLMIGCAAEALGEAIRTDPVEIEDARWVSREEMAQVFAGDHPVIKAPRRGAIASFLLGEWLADRIRG